MSQPHTNLLETGRWASDVKQVILYFVKCRSHCTG